MRDHPLKCSLAVCLLLALGCMTSGCGEGSNPKPAAAVKKKMPTSAKSLQDFMKRRVEMQKAATGKPPPIKRNTR
jgi:hypothetical protein